MDEKTKLLYRELYEKLLGGPVIEPDEIPRIDIYMDQLTTFMDQRLRSLTRDPEHDKVLTKTMINNYTKNELLPPPVRKKYSREHLILLIYIFYLKNNLSMNDIGKLLDPIRELYDAETLSERTLLDVYAETLQWRQEEKKPLEDDLERILSFAEQTFSDVKSVKQKKRLQRFSLLFLLARDVYLKQMLIERLIDVFAEEGLNEKELAEKKEKMRRQKEKERAKEEKAVKKQKESPQHDAS